MTLLLGDTLLQRRPIASLAKALYRDREAFLQLLLSLCDSKTLDRIERCPTYPVRTVTPDLEERLQLFHDGIASDPYGISNAFAVLYESATRNDLRRNLGQYFTPLQVARQAIAYLALKDRETVLDPGCGTGIFPLTILRDISTGRSRDPASLEYIGIENDPTMALSTAISLEWVNAPRKWRVLYANFLTTELKDLEGINYKKIDAIIANPPFVRFHRLSERSELTNKPGLSMFSGLHSFFLAHSSELLDEGRMAFIVPLEMSGTQYGSKLLKELRRKFSFSSKIMYHDKKRNTWHMTDVQDFTLQKHPRIRQVWTLMQFDAVVIDKTTMFSKQSRSNRAILLATVPLDYFAKVHRGISTGANNFFVLTEKMVKEIGVPKRYLRKIIPTRIRKTELPDVFKEENWDDLREKGKRCWLLCLPDKIPTDDLPPGVRQYIREGERLGVHLVPTCRNRRPWYYIRAPPMRIPDLVFTYMSRGYPKFVYNKASLYNLTNLLGVYLRPPTRLPTDKMANLTGLLNSELKNWIDREPVGRKYAGGLIKFEPGDLKKMPISESALEKLGISYKSLGSHLEQE